jgi:hypothetical protein
VGEASKPIALRVAAVAFQGLAPLFLEHGITVPEATNLLRAVCVHQAARRSGGGERPLNDSQVEALTNVNRHVVAKLLKRAPDECVAESAVNATIMRVIEGWEIDHSQQGRPIDLEMGDPDSVGPSVWSLVRRYAPDYWPRVIIDELVRGDLVETLGNRRLRLKPNVRTRFLPGLQDLEQAAQRMHDLVSATFKDFAESKSTRRVRTAQSLDIDPADAHLVRKMLADRVGWMCSWLTDELNSPRWRRKGTGQRMRLGVTTLMFDEVLVKELPNEGVKTAEGNPPKKKARKATRFESPKTRKR